MHSQQHACMGCVVMLGRAYLTAVDGMLEGAPEPHVVVGMEMGEEIHETLRNGAVAECVHRKGSAWH